MIQYKIRTKRLSIFTMYFFVFILIHFFPLIVECRHFDDDNDAVRVSNQKMHADMHPSENVEQLNEERQQRLIDHVEMLKANLQKQKEHKNEMIEDYEQQLNEKEEAWQGALSNALARRTENMGKAGGSKIVEETPLTKCLDELREVRSETSYLKQESISQLNDISIIANENKLKLNEQLSIVEEAHEKALKMKSEKAIERTFEFSEVVKEKNNFEMKTLQDRILELENLKTTKFHQYEMINSLNNNEKLTVKLSHWHIDSLSSIIIIFPILFIFLFYLTIYKKCDIAILSHFKINMRVISLLISKFLSFLSFILTIISLLYDDPFDDKFYYSTIKHENEVDSVNERSNDKDGRKDVRINNVDNWNQFSVHTIRSLQSNICLILFIYFTILLLTTITNTYANYFQLKKSNNNGHLSPTSLQSDSYISFIMYRLLQFLLLFFIFVLWYMVSMKHEIGLIKHVNKYWLSCIMYGIMSFIFIILTLIEPSIKQSNIHSGGSFDISPTNSFRSRSIDFMYDGDVENHQNGNTPTASSTKNSTSKMRQRSSGGVSPSPKYGYGFERQQSRSATSLSSEPQAGLNTELSPPIKDRCFT